jgi:hypothetical protein
MDRPHSRRRSNHLSGRWAAIDDDRTMLFGDELQIAVN